MTADIWFRDHQLVHYTSSIEAVGSILQRGFFLVPNKRQLIQRLLGENGFQHREPQEFGMASFTELRIEDAKSHREQFGSFGIAVSWEWARSHRAQRVLYVSDDNGPVIDALAWLFQLARQELERGWPEKVTEPILANKAVSGMWLCGQVYSKLLTLYEFMQPERNSSQAEWRIVNTIPYYVTLAEPAILIKRALSGEQPLPTLAIEPRDVTFLVCPPRDVRNLRLALPEQFRSVPVYAYGTIANMAWLLRRIAGSVRSALALRSRQIKRPGAYVKVSRDRGDSIYTVPPLLRMNGLVVHPDRLLDRASVSLQYASDGIDTCDMRMSYTEALRLLGYLTMATRDSQMAPLTRLAIQRLSHNQPRPASPDQREEKDTATGATPRSS